MMDLPSLLGIGVGQAGNEPIQVPAVAADTFGAMLAGVLPDPSIAVLGKQQDTEDDPTADGSPRREITLGMMLGNPVVSQSLGDPEGSETPDIPTEVDHSPDRPARFPARQTWAVPEPGEKATKPLHSEAPTEMPQFPPSAPTPSSQDAPTGRGGDPVPTTETSQPLLIKTSTRPSADAPAPEQPSATNATTAVPDSPPPPPIPQQPIPQQPIPQASAVSPVSVATPPEPSVPVVAEGKNQAPEPPTSIRSTSSRPVEASEAYTTPRAAVAGPPSPHGSIAAPPNGPVTSARAHALGQRIEHIARQLEAQPPPRSVTIRVDDGQPVLITVSLRAEGVHLGVAGARTSDLPWLQTVARQLTDSGFSFAGFSEQQRRDPDQPGPYERPDPPPRPHRQRRDGLRL